MNTSRQRSCVGKVRHKTMAAAHVSMRITGRVNGDLALLAYKCRFCGGYHVGHPTKSFQKKIRYQRLLNLIDRANGR